jgi:SLOG in TRPM, prokaryote/SMODS and SLOG-associating 2TM effector domain 1/Protein of unknown function (DUF4231)
MADQEIQPQEVVFPINNNRVKIVQAPPGASASSLVKALGISQPQSVILLLGGADQLDETLKNRLAQLFSRGIARAAADANALIMDGGTQAGVMAIMGQGVADRGRKSSLLGVAPAGKVTFPGRSAVQAGNGESAPLDPNHSHFVLVEGNKWGSETGMLFEIAAVFNVPVLAILVNGGTVAKDGLLQSVRHGWPVIVIEGSGGLADEIAALVKQPKEIDDPALAEISAEGDLRLFPIDGALEDFEGMLFSQSPNTQLLQDAWRRFATYDANANRLQNSFRKLQFWILAFGLIAVLLVVLEKQGTELVKDQRVKALKEHPQNFKKEKTLQTAEKALGGLRLPIIVVPIIISVLLAYYNKFRSGTKWVLLRGSAEAIKREIYWYRSRTGPYSDRLTTGSRDDVFHDRIEPVSRRLMQTEVNHGALTPYGGPIPPKMEGVQRSNPQKTVQSLVGSWLFSLGSLLRLSGLRGAAPEEKSTEVTEGKGDDGTSFLTPARYIEIRLQDQLNYYSKKTPALGEEIKRMQIAILVSGGLGTLLAAVGAELWVALTTSLATALTSLVASRQLEETLVRYNQSAADLANVKDWWTKLSPAARRNPKNIDQLVEVTEKVLEGELSGWVQRMENALAQLTQLKVEDEKDKAQSSAPETSKKPPESGAENASNKENPAPESPDTGR